MALEYYVLAASIEVTSSNNTVKFNETGSANPRTATVTTGTYCVYGAGTESGNIDAGNSSGDLCAAVKTAMDAATGAAANTYTIAYSAFVNGAGVRTGKVNLSANNATFQLVNSGSTFPFTVLGFPQADSATAIDHPGTLSPTHTWVSNQPPRILDEGPFLREVHQHESPEGQQWTFVASDVRTRRRLGFLHVTGDHVLESNIAADTARSFESWWKLANDGRRVRLYSEESTAGTLATLSSTDLLGTYVLDVESCRSFEPQRHEAMSIYAWDVLLREYVS